jgi:MerR family mercuric resistance operon transcriptional regulator
MYSIGEASRRSGVNVETIRYYERRGVVRPPVRSASGRRLYDSDGIARLRFVRRCRDLGFPIERIRALLALPIDDRAGCRDVKAIGEEHLREVRSRIADLRRLETVLAGLIAECGQGGPQCPALQQLFDD